MSWKFNEIMNTYELLISEGFTHDDRVCSEIRILNPDLAPQNQIWNFKARIQFLTSEPLRSPPRMSVQTLQDTIVCINSKKYNTFEINSNVYWWR